MILIKYSNELSLTRNLYGIMSFKEESKYSTLGFAEILYCSKTFAKPIVHFVPFLFESYRGYSDL